MSEKLPKTTADNPQAAALGGQINSNARYCLGRLLTFVDAITVDEKQRKAMKDLINDNVWRLMRENENSIADSFGLESFPVSRPTTGKE